MRRVRFALLAVLTALAACSPALPPAQNYATIVGRVYDAATNTPLGGVTVTASTVLTATTASDGSYRIANVPIGQNEVVPTAPSGYAAQQQVYLISPQPGETLRVDIPLNRTR